MNKVVHEIKNLLRKEDAYYFEYQGEVLENNSDKKQLIASLTKPIIKYYFEQKVFNEEISAETPLRKIISTDLSVNLDQIITHSAGLWDYLENMTEEEINSIGLEALSKKIVTETEKLPTSKNISFDFVYSNSSYVLLSHLIEVIKNKPYEDEVSAFYKERGVHITLKSEHSRWLTGWGDGAVVCSVRDYLNFTTLKDSASAFGSVDSPYGKLATFLGFVPGYETFVAFSDSFKLVYFIEGTSEPGHTDLLYKELGGKF